MGQSTRAKCRPPLALALQALVWGLAIWAGVATAPLGLVAASAPTSHEYEVKAAALYNIISFVEWPDSAFASPEAPLVIAVYGRGPIAGVLADLIRNETWKGRKLMLQNNPTPNEAKSAQVVFVSRTEETRWPFLHEQFDGRAILTVSDAENFATEAGMVQFSIERNKLHLTVNLKTLRAVRLQLNSAVLRLATVIDS